MDHMTQLRDALRSAGIRQPVTFPIRAGLSTSSESQRSITWLLDQVIVLSTDYFSSHLPNGIC